MAGQGAEGCTVTLAWAMVRRQVVDTVGLGLAAADLNLAAGSGAPCRAVKQTPASLGRCGRPWRSWAIVGGSFWNLEMRRPASCLLLIRSQLGCTGHWADGLAQVPLLFCISASDKLA